ncbi:ATP synthase F1 subunit gamma [Rapidithrix thailandica]|uniref:ATP synthase gamma chain n=1 Tax=Rapidithrix thailandica TaxID=413964 RepID=A0AAW9S6Y0_9BACT
MASLKEVKTRINSVISTQQITKAMKMVAAAKLRRAQDKIIQLRPYSQKLEGILHNVASAVAGEQSSKYTEEREVKKVLLVVISSDRGLCGSFNSNAIKQAISLMEGKYAELNRQGNVEVMCIGSKAHQFFSKRGDKVIDEYVELFHHLTFDEVRKAAEHVMYAFRTGEFDKVELIYNEFKNVATQVVRAEEFLPLKQKESSLDETASSQELDYIFEPSKVQIVEELIPKTLKISFYKALLESNASEHGARMTSMDKATDNASELLKDLRLTYNRTRQAAITKEILEIVGGAEALAQS